MTSTPKHYKIHQMKKLIGLTIIAVVSFLALGANLYASSNVPSFPSCNSLSGTGNWASIRNGYNHIPGQEQNIYGDDDVYFFEGGNFVQCLCPANSNTGIQTNWWKVSSLTADEIQILKNEGWYLIPNGSLWGLDEAPYMAQNANYACGSQGTILASAASTSNASNSQVLGFATTGNAFLVLVVFGLSIFALALAVLAYKLD